jgi:hypothetical protein
MRVGELHYGGDPRRIQRNMESRWFLAGYNDNQYDNREMRNTRQQFSEM